MLRVGLTGGIGSGKSSVSAQLRDLGATIVDYDLLARQVVEPGAPALAAIAARFGPSVISSDGTLIRPALGAIVFADPQARRDLEAITHPAIRAASAALESAAGSDAVVVHDNPLLVEMGGAAHCDVVVVVDLPEELQIDRLVSDRGMTADEARARMAAQASRADRLAVADFVIDNSGSRDQLADRVRALWTDLERRAAPNATTRRT